MVACRDLAAEELLHGLASYEASLTPNEAEFLKVRFQEQNLGFLLGKTGSVYLRKHWKCIAALDLIFSRLIAIFMN